MKINKLLMKLSGTVIYSAEMTFLLTTTVNSLVNVVFSLVALTVIMTRLNVKEIPLK